MLMPKRVKRRKQFRGSMRGKALRGNKITYGEYGIVATEPAWITANQIEAARVAMTRLINLALPRVRDFRGVNQNSFDGRGNYALGIKEQLIFPEIEYDKVDKVRGMDIIFVTTANTDEEARELLTLFGMPFKK